MVTCPLTHLEIGEKCRLKEILASPELCYRLKEMGFCDNVEITVKSKELICKVCQSKFGICPKLAEKFIVEKFGKQL